MKVEETKSEDYLSKFNYLDSVLENLPFGIQIFDNKGTTEYLNLKQAEILGLKDKAIAIGNFNVLTDPFSIANGSAEFYQKVYKEKKPAYRNFEINFDIQGNKWDTAKGIRYLYENVIPLINHNGEVSHVVSTLTDLTDQKLSNDIPHNSEQRFRSIFENAVAGIAFTDANGNIILTNNSFEQIVGYKANELTGKRFADITYKEDLHKESELLRCAIEAKTDTCRLEKRYVHKDGTPVWVDVSIAVIRDQENSPINFVAIVKDIENKKQADAKLSEALSFNTMILETSPVGIVVVEESGQISFANRKAEILLGLSKDDIKQRSYNAPMWKITDLHGDPFPDDELPFMRVKKEKKPVNNIQHGIEWPNGKRVFLSINASPQLGDDIEFLGMIASMEDITEKVEAENRLRENNAFLNAMISNAAEGLCVCHNCTDFPYVNFTVWNNEMTRITGYTMADINKLGWYQTLYADPEIREKAISRMANMRMGDNISGEEWTITRKDKEQRVVSIATSVISTYGDQVHVMALINDITEKQQAKIQLEHANKDLKKTNDSKDRFLAILAHDLKGPLGASLSLSELLLEEENHRNEEETKVIADHLNQSVKRSFNLLNELLEWSQAQTNKLDFNPKKFNLHTLIEKTIDTLSGIAGTKEVSLLQQPNGAMHVLADEDMIQTVIRNMINNAIKYSHKGGKVMVNVVDKKEETVVSVIDDGVGIDKERLDKLFKIDENVSTRGTDNEKGTGLGLLLCKELIKYHNGAIWAKSKIGKGSEFIFSIPKTQV